MIDVPNQLEFTPLRPWILLICILVLTSCGNESQQNSLEPSDSAFTEKIYNGNEFDPALMPALVLIRLSYLNGDQGLCTGTVIGEYSVLTAGHCSEDGLVDVEILSLEGSHSVATIVTHPNYFEDAEIGAIFNDVAILKTRTPFQKIPPLPIRHAALPTTQQTFTVYGMGLTEENLIGFPQFATAMIEHITPSHLISFPYQSDLANPCFGDSGGPLVALSEQGALELVGVVSTGTTESCGYGDQSLYTNVTNPELLQFIDLNK